MEALGPCILRPLPGSAQTGARTRPIFPAVPVVRDLRGAPPAQRKRTDWHGGIQAMERRLPRTIKARPGPRPRWLRPVTLAGLVIAALLPCGCLPAGLKQWVHNGFKVGPNYTRPPAPVAPEWIQAADPRTQGPPPRDGDW